MKIFKCVLWTFFVIYIKKNKVIKVIILMCDNFKEYPHIFQHITEFFLKV